MVQWLRPHASNARGIGSIPGKETKIPDAVWCCQTNKQTKNGEERMKIPPENAV